MYTIFLDQSNFGFSLSLSFVADFSTTRARTLPLSSRAKGDAYWTYAESYSHGNCSLAVFIS